MSVLGFIFFAFLGLFALISIAEDIRKEIDNDKDKDDKK